MKHDRASSFGPVRTLRPRPFALRYRRACSGWTRNIEVSLCPLCLCALCVQRKLPGLVLRDIDVCCWKAAFDTEDTEAQRTQRNFRLSKFALRYRRACSGRTRNIEVSLCPLCLCALCVQRELPGL